MNASPAEEGEEGEEWRVRVETSAHDQSRVYMAGRDLHHVTYAAPAPVTALHTLPRDVAAFTGRDEELRSLLRAADTGGTRVVSVHTVDGMPGVGKTALVTRAAHLLADRFPDGRLFVDLYGHTPGQPAAEPADVPATLLYGVGVAPQYLPDGLQARSALWRDRLAGKRVLLVLDNAVGAAQVEPLLPASDGCLVLVTSRRRLLALDGARPLSVEPLPPDTAAALFTRVARRALDASNTGAVAEAVRLCGFLPLAITLLGARLAHHPAWPLAAFLEEFAAAQDRLGELEAGDRAVRAAFDLSYLVLPAERQHLFRRLGLHPGPDLDLHAAAALGDLPPTVVRRQMEALYVDHLVESPAPYRYRTHDLLRAYAATLAAGEPRADRAQALERLFGHYRRAAHRADQKLTTTPRPGDSDPSDAGAEPPAFGSREQALAWMRTERLNLLACVKKGLTGPRPSDAVSLTHLMAAFLHREGPWPQAVALHRAAAAAARDHDPHDEANALRDLGRALQLTGDYAAAEPALAQALDLFRTARDPLGEANTLRDLGWVRQVTGDYAGAQPLLEQALRLYRTQHSRLGEANTLRTQGWIGQLTGDYTTATAVLARALRLYRALGDRNGEANTLHDLGRLRRATGDYEGAAESLEEALAIFRALGTRLGETNTLWALSRVREMTGDYASAAGLLEEALALYRELSAPIGEAHALRNLGQVRLLTGEYASASAVLHEALRLFRSLGARHGQANALRSLGRVRLRTGDHGEAAALLTEALALYRALGARPGEAHTLHGIGVAHHRRGSLAEALDLLDLSLGLFKGMGDPQGEAEVLNSRGALLAETAGPPAALEAHLAALRLARLVRSPLDEAHALEGAAHCRELDGRRQAALADLRQAVAIYTRIGAAEADAAATRLAALEAERPDGG